MMKKILGIISAAMLVVFLMGCADKEEVLLSEQETVYTISPVVRIRKSPSTETNENVANLVPLGRELTKIGDYGEWSIITMDGERYYVLSEYLSNEKLKDNV